MRVYALALILTVITIAKMKMQTYSGSKRTFTTLLRSMLSKNKIGIVRALV